MDVFLLCHRGALGDFILTWPTILALRWKFRHMDFIGLGKPEYWSLARELCLVDHFIDAESSEMLPFFNGVAMPNRLQDVSGAVLWLEQEEGLKKLLSDHCSGPLHFHPPFPGPNTHAMEHHFDLLPVFSLPIPLQPDPFFPLPVAREDFALIHPGSGSKKKNFDPEVYLQLASELSHSKFPDIRILLGPADLHLLPEFEGRFKVIQPPDITSLARILAKCAFFVGNDSGVSHLAAFLGTRSIALYKSNNHLQWGIRGLRSHCFEVNNEVEVFARVKEFFR